MCVVCGCSGEQHQSKTVAAAAPNNGDLDFGANAARVSVPGMSTERAIRIEADVLGENDRVAARNRAHFVAHGVTALNLVSSPGSGKTTLLCATIAALRRRAPEVEVAVIEGDQQTSNDADRIRATGAPAVQVNTGKGCHLDAPMVAAAFERLPLHRHGHDEHGAHLRDASEAHGHDHAHAGHGHHGHHGHHDDRRGHGHDHHGHAHAERLLFIENVGNLVCPAMWDLGEAAKVAILSVTEGEDKPLKYPDMFAAARLMVLNKTDLLPYLDFDVERCIAYARRVNPAIEVLQVSAKTGDGIDAWLSWLLHLTPDASTDAALRRRIADLEAQVRALGGQA